MMESSWSWVTTRRGSQHSQVRSWSTSWNSKCRKEVNCLMFRVVRSNGVWWMGPMVCSWREWRLGIETLAAHLPKDWKEHRWDSISERTVTSCTTSISSGIPCMASWGITSPPLKWHMWPHPWTRSSNATYIMPDPILHVTALCSDGATFGSAENQVSLMMVAQLSLVQLRLRRRVSCRRWKMVSILRWIMFQEERSLMIAWISSCVASSFVLWTMSPSSSLPSSMSTGVGTVTVTVNEFNLGVFAV